MACDGGGVMREMNVDGEGGRGRRGGGVGRHCWGRNKDSFHKLA